MDQVIETPPLFVAWVPTCWDRFRIVWSNFIGCFKQHCVDSIHMFVKVEFVFFVSFNIVGEIHMLPVRWSEPHIWWFNHMFVSIRSTCFLRLDHHFCGWTSHMCCLISNFCWFNPTCCYTIQVSQLLKSTFNTRNPLHPPLHHIIISIQPDMLVTPPVLLTPRRGLDFPQFLKVVEMLRQRALTSPTLTSRWRKMWVLGRTWKECLFQLVGGLVAIWIIFPLILGC